MYKSLNAHIFTCLALICFMQSIQTNSEDVQNLPAPYNSLEKILPFDNHGWYGNSDWIQCLFKNNNIHTAIEVGSWLGSSTRHIASLLPTDGMLYAIDTWQGSAEHQPGNNPHGVAHKLPTLYAQFLSNVIHANLAHQITPVRMTSLQASEYLSHLKQHIDFIYLDAAHDTESVLEDMEAWYPYVSGRRGILCGDDWSWESVKKAVRIFAQKYQVTIYAHQYFWFIVENNQFDERSFLNASHEIWNIIK